MLRRAGAVISVQLLQVPLRPVLLVRATVLLIALVWLRLTTALWITVLPCFFTALAAVLSAMLGTP